MSADPHEVGMLFDERFVPRKVVLDRFFTPSRNVRKSELPAERLYQIGDDMTYANLRPRSAFVAQQIRDAYDPYRIVRTGISMIEGINRQLQNCGVSFLDEEALPQYVDDLNYYFGSDINPEEIERHTKFGFYIVSVFGHNRQLGVASYNLAKNGHPDVSSTFFARVFTNPPFWQMIEAQAVENSGVGPEMWDRSRSIVAYQRLRDRDGLTTPPERVAKLFNVDTDQVWRAKRYENPPEGVKDLVMSKRLPYSASFELDVLLPLYGELYVLDLARRLADRKCSTPQVMLEVKKRIAAAELPPEATALVERDQISLENARILRELVGVIDVDELVTLSSWVALSHPDPQSLSQRVQCIINDKLGGVVSLFGQESDDTEAQSLAELEAMAKRLDANQQRARIQSVASELTKLVGKLRAQYEVGLVGAAAKVNPIINGNPEHLLKVLQGCVEGNSITQEVLDALHEFKDYIESDGDVVDAAFNGVFELLNLELEETADTQRRRRESLPRICEAHGAVASQAALF
jgi:hypothetical protein